MARGGFHQDGAGRKLMPEFDIAALQRWAGNRQELADEMDPFRARALAAAFNRVRLFNAGDALPPSWHWLYFLETPAGDETGTDGHPHQTNGFLPPAPLPRRMWAAGRLKIARPIRLGATARKHSVIKSIEVKDGKTGRLVFVNVEHSIAQQSELCIVEEQNLVYREMPTAAGIFPAGAAAPMAADWRLTIDPDAMLLFRFSALTYNSHRIHYDRDYAVAREFYPGLVVHGPLQATLLLDLAEAHGDGARVQEFQFRAVRPMFDFGPVTICGKRVGGRADLWTEDQQGGVCMTAVAQYAPGQG